MANHRPKISEFWRPYGPSMVDNPYIYGAG